MERRKKGRIQEKNVIKGYLSFLFILHTVPPLSYLPLLVPKGP
jgi:hypothetical protein